MTDKKREEILLKAKPILFNTEMVRAIPDGRKTQTRRAVKPQPEIFGGAYLYKGAICAKSGLKNYAPYQNSDILYVRETWYYEEHMHDMTASDPDLPSGRYSHRYIFKADCPDYPVNVGIGPHGWKPSIHMPKEAARLFLRVTNVSVAKLQDITGEDIVKEGIDREPLDEMGEDFFKGMFHDLWDSTVKKSDLDRYGWNADPWVWVIEFERID